MKTAEEFLSEKLGKTPIGILPNVMIEFAKMHVEFALKEASEKAFTNVDGTTVNKDSILNAYPLSNIK